MDISLSSDALDVSFHPSSSTTLLATGLISGKVQLIDFGKANDGAINASKGADTDSDDDCEEDSKVGESSKIGTQTSKEGRMYDKVWSVRPSNKSCRGVAFDVEGDGIFTLAKDGSIFRLDTESGSVVSQWNKAHSSAPSRILPIEKNLFASGDDDGVISLWDPRRPTTSNSAVRSYDHHFDWITSMLWCTHLAPPKTPKLSKEEEEKKRLREEKKRKRKQKKGRNNEGEDDELDETLKPIRTQRERLVVTSGDGTLSVIDVRTGKSGVEISEDQEDELLSITSVKNNSKLIVGTQSGILSLWAPTKGLLDHVDRIPGHPASVDTMCALDEDTILTGSSDGLVRVVQILPHKLLGIVADHGGMPVERIARRDNWMASIGHGAEIKLTDLAPLLEDDEGDEDDEERPLGVINLSSGNLNDSSDSEDDGVEDDVQGVEVLGKPNDDTENAKSKTDDDDDSSQQDDDSSEEEVHQPKSKKIRNVGTLLRPIDQTEQDADNANFFADL